MESVNKVLNDVSLKKLTIVSYDLVDRDFKRLLSILQKQRKLTVINMKITSAAQIDKLMSAASNSLQKVVFWIPKKTSMKFLTDSISKWKAK